MTKWGEHIRASTMEPDGVTPSSARLYALWLIGFVLLAQFIIVDCLVWKLLTLDATLPTAPALANTYASILRAFMLWTMLFDVATALSLYGINIWKYVAAIRTGVPLNESDPEAATPKAVVRTGAKIPPKPAPEAKDSPDEETGSRVE